MIQLGMALRSNHWPRHIHVVLSDPSQTGQILLVNFTSFKSPRDDGREIFGPADYSILDHDSVIAFWGCRSGPTASVEAFLLGPDFTPLPNVPRNTVARMVVEAKASRELSPARKALLP
jgi:hypothetical protein